MFILRSLPLITILVILSAAALGQGPSSSGTASAAEKDENRERIIQLEGQLKEMQRQIDELKAAMQKNNAAVAAVDPKPAAGAAAVSTQPAAPEVNQADAQKKDLGVDVGSARLTPYGTIYALESLDTAGTNNTDVPTFATPTGLGNASASVRQTRLGLRLEGARVGAARLSAVVDADFFGGFPSVGIGENCRILGGI